MFCREPACRQVQILLQMVAVVQLVEHLIVVQDVAGSIPVSHPIILTPYNLRSCEGFFSFQT
jgi:hypothetical protein